MIANNFDEFVEKVIKAETSALNSKEGQELTGYLLEAKLKENPNMTTEEWNKTKQEFMMFIFAKIMEESSELMKEMVKHTYNELRGGN